MQKHTDSGDAGQLFILLGLFLYMAVFGVSLGPVVWLYIPEIVQPKIVPFSTATNWISCSLIIILFPILSDDVFDHDPTYLFAFFCFSCWSVPLERQIFKISYFSN